MTHTASFDVDADTDADTGIRFISIPASVSISPTPIVKVSHECHVSDSYARPDATILDSGATIGTITMATASLDVEAVTAKFWSGSHVPDIARSM